MLRKSLIVGALAIMASAIAGCYVYYPEDNGGDSFVGWDCDVNADCAAGCYCTADGYCEEAGFCDEDIDCAPGFVCDDRNSCVPGTPGDQTCEVDEDCLEGCFCNDDGLCEETGVCADDTECAEGQTCDTDRNTCVPADPVSECLAPADCGIQPECDPGTSAEIVDGCYTGICIANEDCTDGSPCSQQPDQATCDARMDCSSVVNGINCTDPDGNACQAGVGNCTCEQVLFDSCEDAATEPDPGA
jgi:hypothetical protein